MVGSLPTGWIQQTHSMAQGIMTQMECPLASESVSDLTDTGVIWKNIASQLPLNTDTMAQIPEFQILMETV